MDHLKFLSDPLSSNTNEEDKTLDGQEISPPDGYIKKKTLTVKVRETSSSSKDTPSSHNIFNQIDNNTLK